MVVATWPDGAERREATSRRALLPWHLLCRAKRVVACGDFEPVAVASGRQHGGVVHDPVDDRSGGRGIEKHVGPASERQIRGHHEAAALVALTDEAEQQVGAGLVERDKVQGWLRLPSGAAVTGFAHGYKRHGTTTLFAALEVATGFITARHYWRRRRREFLDFMNTLVELYDGWELHVVLDNLNTHKPTHDRWLRRHPNVHFHCIPTYSSWLNQVEVWFSILTRRALTGASFTSPRQVWDAIDAFVKVYNPKATPFEWTKEVVHPTRPSRNYANLRH